MKLVCFDTQILIWGVQGTATQSQQNMIKKTKRFLNHLQEQKTRVMIPSIVVGEYLLGIPQELHLATTNLFQRAFIVEPFDLRASAEFARIWQHSKGNTEIQEIRSDLNISRQVLKADFMIVATAVSKKADCIYSHDTGLKNFAKGHIEVLEIPDLPEQLELL